MHALPQKALGYRLKSQTMPASHGRKLAREHISKIGYILKPNLLNGGYYLHLLLRIHGYRVQLVLKLSLGKPRGKGKKMMIPPSKHNQSYNVAFTTSIRALQGCNETIACFKLAASAKQMVFGAQLCRSKGQCGSAVKIRNHGVWRFP